jgi:hypothetical protein
VQTGPSNNPAPPPLPYLHGRSWRAFGEQIQPYPLVSECVWMPAEQGFRTLVLLRKVEPQSSNLMTRVLFDPLQPLREHGCS